MVFGWPRPATFTAIVENNIITNNKTNGIVNYKGPEKFPAPGATIINNHNNVWNNEKDYEGCDPGAKDISKDPLFVSVDSVENGNYFLSHRDSGQKRNSPAVNRGSEAAAKLGMGYKTTRTDKAGDKGRVDVGYHYPVKPVKN